MNVKRLKELLDDKDDNADVIIYAKDHVGLLSNIFVIDVIQEDDDRTFGYTNGAPVEIVI